MDFYGVCYDHDHVCYGEFTGLYESVGVFLQFDASFSDAKMICLIRDIIGAEVPPPSLFFLLIKYIYLKQIESPQIDPESHLNIVVVVSNFISQFNTIC
jgi:hypothetical protein